MSYIANITDIGPMVADFKEAGVLVLFGPSAPNELREISVIHDMKQEVEDNLIKPGTKIKLGNYEYIVDQVGSEANNNFKKLGHISIYFIDSEEHELLPGAIHVKETEFPTLKVGDTVEINN